MTDDGRFDIVVERAIAAPPDDLYEAFTRAAALRDWFCHGASVGRNPGERFVLWWEDGSVTAGTLEALTPGEQVAFTWRGTSDPAATHATVRLHPAGKATRVVVRHSGLGDGGNWAPLRDELMHRWSFGLESLQLRMETGEDLRGLRRPILGILVGEYTPAIASQLGIPGVQGVRVHGHSDEADGAAQAGLRSDDVIVAVDGHPISGVTALTGALDGHKAGDSVEVAFMRERQRMTAHINLGSRPLVDVRDRAGVLNLVHSEYHDAYCAISDLLRYLPDEVAAARPAEGEWSALEIAAHLIITERDLHLMIASLFASDERWVEDDKADDSGRLAAIVATYPTVPGMLSALRHAYCETREVLAALPADSPRTRSAWVRSARTVIAMKVHLDEHAAQMRRVCDALRQHVEMTPSQKSRAAWRYSGL